jgi:hypothetical protein
MWSGTNLPAFRVQQVPFWYKADDGRLHDHTRFTHVIFRFLLQPIEFLLPGLPRRTPDLRTFSRTNTGLQTLLYRQTRQSERNSRREQKAAAETAFKITLGSKGRNNGKAQAKTMVLKPKQMTERERLNATMVTHYNPMTPLFPT